MNKQSTVATDPAMTGFSLPYRSSPFASAATPNPIQIQNDSQTSHEKQEESHPETLDPLFARISLEQQT